MRNITDTVELQKRRPFSLSLERCFNDEVVSTTNRSPHISDEEFDADREEAESGPERPPEPEPEPEAEPKPKKVLGTCTIAKMPATSWPIQPLRLIL